MGPVGVVGLGGGTLEHYGAELNQFDRPPRLRIADRVALSDDGENQRGDIGEIPVYGPMGGSERSQGLRAFPTIAKVANHEIA